MLKNKKLISIVVVVVLVGAIAFFILNSQQNNSNLAESNYSTLLDAEDKKILLIDSEEKLCQGEGEYVCYTTKEYVNGEFKPYGSIDSVDNLTMEEGYNYVVLVRAEDIPNPPQDGSSIKYVLVQQLKKTPK